MPQGHESQPEITPSGFGQSWDDLSNQINNVVLGYNPNYKPNMYEPTWTEINDWLNGCSTQFLMQKDFRWFK